MGGAKGSELHGCYHDDERQYIFWMHGVQRRMISVVNVFVFLRQFFCFVVAICDLVHAVEAMYGLL